MWDDHSERVAVVGHRIDLVDKDAQACKPTLTERGARKVSWERPNFGSMLRDGIADQATTEWASLKVITGKKDGTLQLCACYVD